MSVLELEGVGTVAGRAEMKSMGIGDAAVVEGIAGDVVGALDGVFAGGVVGMAAVVEGRACGLFGELVGMPMAMALDSLRAATPATAPARSVAVARRMPAVARADRREAAGLGLVVGWRFGAGDGQRDGVLRRLRV